MHINYFLLLLTTLLVQTSVLAQDKVVPKKYYNFTYVVEKTNQGGKSSVDTILNHVNQVTLPYFVSSNKNEQAYLANYIHANALDADTFNMTNLNADWISSQESKKPSTTKIYYKKEVCNQDIVSIRLYKNEYDCCKNTAILSRQFNYPFTLDRNTKKVLLLKDAVDTLAFKKEYLLILSTVKKDNTLDPIFYEAFIKTTNVSEILNKNIVLDHDGLTFYVTLKTTTNRLKEYVFYIDYENHKHLILPYIKKYIKNFPPEAHTVDVE